MAGVAVAAEPAVEDTPGRQAAGQGAARQAAAVEQADEAADVVGLQFAQARAARQLGGQGQELAQVPAVVADGVGRLATLGRQFVEEGSGEAVAVHGARLA
ncbi:hypothetical protein AZSP09_22150 [Azospira sp. I09]|nr:hypothetical protein AZSP09_22150 [Azospira sp. I09]